MDARHKIWCDDDEHHLYEHYVVFNDWLDGEEGQELREEYGIGTLSQPSKAFYAGDKEAYEQAFKKYRKDRRHEALNETYLKEQFRDAHWFDRNIAHFEQLVKRLEQRSVVPFIGAGLSVSGGFPSWRDHLRQQGRTAGLEQGHIEALLAEGRYESVLEEIETVRGREVFTNEIRDVFSRTGTIPDAIWRISELFNDTVITTNYDRLIEQAYETGETDPYQIINGTNALEKPDADRVTIIKLHGDILDVQRCILSKNQYDKVYGLGALDLERPIPKLLSYYYRNSSLLFLGCSLNNDRTVEVFRAVKATLGEEDIPQHFSIEQVPENEDELRDRNEVLARLGITPIWFEKGCFDYVENMLQLSMNEIGYLGPPQHGADKAAVNVTHYSRANLDIDLNHFLSDFVDLMPLMYWLHRHVPQEDTSRYLSAMQRVFHAYSFFTNDTDTNLLHGLDNLLRALSNKHHFDGYTHGKLSVAFSYIQKFLKSIGEDSHADESFEWDYHEMFSIGAQQLEEVIAEHPASNSLDYTAIRLLVALLRHGRNQLHHQDAFCELPSSVNAEFADYLRLTMSSKLGLMVPDRLDDMQSCNLHDLCEYKWNADDKDDDIGMLDYARMALSQLFSFNRRQF